MSKAIKIKFINVTPIEGQNASNAIKELQQKKGQAENASD